MSKHLSLYVHTSSLAHPSTSTQSSPELHAEHTLQQRLRESLRPGRSHTSSKTIARSTTQPVAMITGDLLQRLVRPLPPATLVDNTHASRPLPASLNPDILIDREFPLRIILIDTVPNRQRIVKLKPDGVAGQLVLQRLDFAESRLQPGGGPGCQRGFDRDQRRRGFAECAAG